MQKLNADPARRLLGSRRGSALVTVVVFSVLIGISGAAFLSLTGTSVNRETAGLLDARAFAAAESGLLMGTQWLSKQENWTPQDESDILGTTLRGESAPNGVDVTVEVVEDDGTITIVSTATHAGMRYNKQLRWEVTQSGGGAPIESPAFDYGMLSDGLVKIESPMASSGAQARIHSNSTEELRVEHDVGADISSRGPVKIEERTVDGDVTAPEVIVEDAVVTGAVTEQEVDPVDFPEIDLGPWKEIAVANEETYSDPALIPDNHTPDGGVMWLEVSGDDNVHLEGKEINGTLIITGTDGMVTVTGGSTVGYDGDDGFTIAAEGVDVKVEEGSTVGGLIYIKEGCFKIENTNPFTGQLLVQGRAVAHDDMNMPGNPGPVKVQIEQIGGDGKFYFSYVRTVPVPPGGDDITLVPGTWQEVNNPI